MRVVAGLIVAPLAALIVSSLAALGLGPLGMVVGFVVFCAATEWLGDWR